LRKRLGKYNALSDDEGRHEAVNKAIFGVKKPFRFTNAGYEGDDLKRGNLKGNRYKGDGSQGGRYEGGISDGGAFKGSVYEDDVYEHGEDDTFAALEDDGYYAGAQKPVICSAGHNKSGVYKTPGRRTVRFESDGEEMGEHEAADSGGSGKHY
jgi:hypothetical protein